MLIHKANIRMAIKQTIKYNSANKYFAGFLQNIIDESEIKASVSQNNQDIELLIDDSDEKALARFSANTTKYLPYSIFIDKIETISQTATIKKSELKSETYNIALCPKCLQLLSDWASEHYLDDMIRCKHYSNNADKVFVDNTIFSPHYSENDTILVIQTKNINNLFTMTEDETKALFSIEKPTIKVTIKDEQLKKVTGKKFINIKSAYNIRSTLVALNAKDSLVPYLFFHPKDDFKVVVVKKDINIIKDDIGLAQSLEELNKDKAINRFLNIKKEAEFDDAICADLSMGHGISFFVSNELGVKRVLKVQDFKLVEVLELMRTDEAKSKMLLNFEKKYQDIIDEMNENGAYNLFETIATVLELTNKCFDGVSDKALEFNGNGGLKIDTFFNDNGFDFVSFLGSIMSFKLAGTEEHYLAYSIFEALGDMAIATLTQLKIKFKTDNFVMMGNMFENSVLHSRIISKFQLSNPYFSKAIALDD